MRKFLIIPFVLLLFSRTTIAQVEKGDSEIRFVFFYSHVNGDEFSTGGHGSLQVSYGYFVTPNLQIGVGPQLTFTRGFDKTEVTIGGSAYFNYNFSVASKTVPYLYGEFYQMDFSPEWGEFSDYTYLNIGAGVRNFFTEYMALNSSITYGFSLGSMIGGGLFMIMTGLSFIF